MSDYYEKLDKAKAGFLRDVDAHVMHIKQDEGVFRHIRFSQGGSSVYHFDITTWPGYLCISGDMGCFVFARTADMFTFFRGDRINPQYWAEKIQATNNRSGHRSFSIDLLKQAVADDFDRWEFDDDAQKTAAWKAITDEWDGLFYDIEGDAMRSAIDISPECLSEILALLQAIGVKPVASLHSYNAVRLVIEGEAVPDAELVDLIVMQERTVGSASLQAKFRVREAPRTIPQIRFRPHRNGLAESMAECVTISATAEALKAHLNECVVIAPITDVKLERHGVGPDPRIGWPETWLVKGYMPDGSSGVMGFTDGNLQA
jgi:hypothetical protein